MKPPSRDEITRLFNVWFHQEKNFPMPSEAFIAGYLLCWKQFEEFVKSEVGNPEEKIQKRYPPLDIGKESRGQEARRKRNT